MAILLTEIWRSWRASLRRPGFLLLAAAVLALGVGSASAVFTMIDGVLLRPMPYPEPQRLVALGGLEQGSVYGMSPQQYQHLGDLSDMAALGIFKSESTATNIAGVGEPVQVPAEVFDHSLLPTLRVQPALGRNFTAQEDQPHGPPAVLLYHGFWLRRFGGDPAVVGKTMQVEGVAHTIVGVLPAGFDLSQASIALPTAFAANVVNDSQDYTVVARLAPGVTREALAAKVDTRLHAFYIAQGHKAYGSDQWLRVHFGAQDLGAEEHQDQRATLLMWLACAALLLLIALVNLANLMMLRAMGRSHEASVRGALGASPWRVALPSMAEGVLVGLLGVLLGQALAALGLSALRTWMPADWMAVEWTRPGGLSLGWPAWILAVAIGLFGALVATLLGWRRGRAALSMDSLREGGRSGFDRRSGRLARALVIAQVLLVACGKPTQDPPAPSNRGADAPIERARLGDTDRFEGTHRASSLTYTSHRTHTQAQGPERMKDKGPAAPLAASMRSGGGRPQFTVRACVRACVCGRMDGSIDRFIRMEWGRVVSRLAPLPTHPHTQPHPPTPSRPSSSPTWT